MAAIALQAASANATTFAWSYAGPGNSGSGTLSATAVGDGSYSVDSIRGTANGQAIVGLDDTFNGPDNTIFPPSPPNFGLDRFGLSFDDAGGIQYNLYLNNPPFSDPAANCGVDYCLQTSTADSALALMSFTLARVPEPATWAMMLLGLGGVGAALRSRRRPVALLA